MKNLFISALLSLSAYCYADTAEYHIIPLSEASETFELSLKKMMRSPQGPNAKGQFITKGHVWGPEIDPYFENIYYNDPSGKSLLIRRGDLPIISDGGFVAGSLRGTVYVWSLKTGCRDFKLNVSHEMYGVNNIGDIVFAAGIERGQENVTFLVTNDNKKINIGSIDSKHFTKGLALNDYRQIVGTVYEPEHEEHAFIWDENNGIRDLRNLISTNSGWDDLLKATHINNDGLIVGDGIYQGQPTQFLLIPGGF